ncbi:MAG: hypothetical protein QN201_04205 [Armatimonadota bacterium]|nr:hypothetical protein [Armatimonadota bacterium]
MDPRRGFLFTRASVPGSGHHALHREILRRTFREQRQTLQQARETLRREREQRSRLLREHRQAFLRARAQAKREGRTLLKILDNLTRLV